MDTETVQPQAGAPVAESAPGAPIPAPTKPTVSATPAAQATEDIASLPEWAQRVYSDLRKENASFRKKQIDAEKLASEAAEKSAKEQGHWQELAEQYEPKAKRADALEAFIAELLEAETASVPDKLKPLLPQGDPLATLRWVQQAKAVGILAAPQAPRTDAGAAGANLARVETEAEKRERAARLGVDWRYLPN